MINLNINESKKLRFKISLSGVNSYDLKGSMKIMIEGIEYGFPIKIENGDIIVEISPLSEICSKKVKNNTILNSKLEVIAGKTYLVPWSGNIKLKNPIKVEARVTGIEIDKSDKLLIPEINVSDISGEDVRKEEDHVKENMKRIIEEIKKDIGKIEEPLEEDIFEEPLEEDIFEEPLEEDIFEEPLEEDIFDKYLNKEIKRKKNRETKLKDIIKNITNNII
jgi:hypothetical protein